MSLIRFCRHVFATRAATRRLFTPAALTEIEAAIKEVESRHSGEICFVVETALDVNELEARVRTLLRARSRTGDSPRACRRRSGRPSAAKSRRITGRAASLKVLLLAFAAWGSC